MAAANPRSSLAITLAVNRIGSSFIAASTQRAGRVDAPSASRFHGASNWIE
jgi:hypothetical protein